MIHIHPFPARMAPEIALNTLAELQEGQIVLDPMSGSGMVLSMAVRRNIQAIGVDLDPLARLISKVGATRINSTLLDDALEQLIKSAKESKRKGGIRLPWIDDDSETKMFIEYWFGKKQRGQLRALVDALLNKRVISNYRVRYALMVAISRLIITKEPKASLARDTAHSRPHRTIEENNFDIFEALPASVRHVKKALSVEDIRVNAKAYLGDARRLDKVASNGVDAIITSPPYLNAIDYMRGHKFSLVWFGYRVAELRAIRGSAIGAERIYNHTESAEFSDLVREFDLGGLPTKQQGMLQRYFVDLCRQLGEAHRVLKPGGVASYVIGNSELRGTAIRNSDFLKKAALLAGLECTGEAVREIPDNLRYLPVSTHAENALAKRMRTEHVIRFEKR